MVAFAARLAPVWWVSAALVLIAWQTFSAGELRYHYRILTRDRILLTQVICLLLVPVLLPVYGVLSWLPALTVAGVHLLISNREYVVIRRRSRSFWDL